MIDVKKAVVSAASFVQDLYSEPLNDLLLEEVELSPDEQFWLITISFTRADINVFQAIGGSATRVYKLVKVDADTGVAVSMKIRQLETAL